MRTLDKKITMNLGKVFLVGALALTGSSLATTAVAGGDCPLPPNLAKLRDEAKNDSKCQKNKGVPINQEHATGEDQGACEGVYKSVIDAIDDYDRKLTDNCSAMKEIQKGNSCAEAVDQAQCQNKAKQLQAKAKEIQDAKETTARRLGDWVQEKKQAAADAKKDLESTGKDIGEKAKTEKAVASSADVHAPAYSKTAKVRKNGVPVPASYVADVVSGISGDIEAMKREQDAAIKFGEQAAKELKTEAAKSAAASTQLDKMSKVTNKNSGGMGSIDKGNGSGSANSQAGNSNGSGQGSGAGAGGGAPSIPSMGQGGGDSGAGGATADAGGASAPATGTGDLSPNSVANKTDSSTGKSSEMKLDATPAKSAVGDLSPTASGEILSGTGSSKMNTSLRDALKKKILGDMAEGGSGEALGGLGFGDNSAEAKKAGAAGAAAATSAGGGLTIPSFGDSGGGDSGAGDFSMSRSETDAAVHNLLSEFGAASGTGADGRSIASYNDAEAGIEGVEGTSLIHRVHEAIVRRLKNGSVANGVNGKI